MTTDRQAIRFTAMLGFQLGILGLGLLLGYACGMVGRTPIDALGLELPAVSWLGYGWMQSVGTGFFFAFVLFGSAWWLARLDFGWWRAIERLLHATLVPSLRRLAVWQLAILALVAGVGEELCFRWALHGAVELLAERCWVAVVGDQDQRPDLRSEEVATVAGDLEAGHLEAGHLELETLSADRVIAGGAGRERWIGRTVFGFAALISAVAFGLCHAVTRAYGLLATMVGLVFSILAGMGGGLVAAMVAHAVYDFIAFLWLCGAPDGSAAPDGAALGNGAN